MPDATDAILEHGTMSADEFPIDEPNLLLKSLNIVPKREKKMYKGPDKVTRLVRFQDPTIEFDFDGIILALDAALTDQHPGTLVDALANFPDDTPIHGFTNDAGLMIYEDPTRSGNNEDPGECKFKVIQYPFLQAA